MARCYDGGMDRKKPARQAAPGPERVRAWIHSVLNPLIEGLEQEIALLAHGEFGWRAGGRFSELIPVLEQRVGYDQQPNLEDFAAENPEFRAAFAKHDELLHSAESAATAIFERLAGDPAFKALVDQSYQRYLAGGTDPLAANLRRDWLPAHAAELLINDTRVLPTYHVLSAFWAGARKDLEAWTRDGDRRVLEARLTSLRRNDESLASRLRGKRRDLAARYDVPWAPVAGGARA